MEYTNVTFESKQYGVFARADTASINENHITINTANYGIVGSQTTYNIVARGFNKLDKFNAVDAQNIDMVVKSDGVTVVRAKGFRINNIDGNVAYISNV